MQAASLGSASVASSSSTAATYPRTRLDVHTGEERRDIDECPDCGDVAVQPAPLWTRLRYWFVNGSGLRGLRICVTCGAPRGDRTWFYGRLTWWSRPVHVVRSLLRMRTWHPVPVFYAAVGAVGAVVGSVAAMLGRGAPRRWAVVGGIGALLTTTVLSIGTVFRGGGVGRKLQLALGSKRSRVLDLEDQIRTVRRLAAGFEVLMPARWDAGPVAIDGIGIRDPDGDPSLSSLGIVAESGPVIGSRPSLHIEHWWNGPPLDIARGQVTREVAYHERHPVAELDGLDARRRRDRERMEAVYDEVNRRQRARERELTGRWRDGSVTLNGQRVSADVLDGDGVSGAVFTDGDVVVELLAQGFSVDGVELRRTTDLEPLLAAKRAREGAR